ncbi:DUF4395 domain-containing protein [Phycicoccus endophyticus]|uniref:DUF4395 domain-containing protein n=1 Tax=Phycicoccus endophyticus TaxID=1690220 RepID=A0A7G9R1V9_9MICO|nr:DUF4395 domain-containing protein [Phycicoccus endophyticus]NHI18617.1 DUF4395 domain-containing protein [Phycicoccus endophyticus]QNN49584.1 DUF4395 domain-containing protein [Phycicoccus endophyticus]
MRSVIGFPAVVNEKAARVVAACVVVVAATALVTGWLWLSVVLAAGFALRVASGPRLDPFGRFATAVVAPRLGAPRLVSGAPKRFAQGVGLAFTAAASVALLLGAPAVAAVLLAVLVVFASLEAFAGFCAGCFAFGQLIRLGLVSDDTCVECADISLRRRESATA